MIKNTVITQLFFTSFGNKAAASTMTQFSSVIRNTFGIMSGTNLSQWSNSMRMQKM